MAKITERKIIFVIACLCMVRMSIDNSTISQLRIEVRQLRAQIIELTTDDETWPKEPGHPDPVPANGEMQEIGVL